MFDAICGGGIARRESHPDASDSRQRQALVSLHARVMRVELT
jgi:hypothetical protein